MRLCNYVAITQWKKVVLLIILGLVTYSLPAQDADTHIASLINNEEWFTLAEDLPQYSDSIQADHQTRVSPKTGGTLAVFAGENNARTGPKTLVDGNKRRLFAIRAPGGSPDESFAKDRWNSCCFCREKQRSNRTKNPCWWEQTPLCTLILWQMAVTGNMPNAARKWISNLTHNNCNLKNYNSSIKVKSFIVCIYRKYIIHRAIKFSPFSTNNSPW